MIFRQTRALFLMSIAWTAWLNAAEPKKSVTCTEFTVVIFDWWVLRQPTAQSFKVRARTWGKSLVSKNANTAYTCVCVRKSAHSTCVSCWTQHKLNRFPAKPIFSTMNRHACQLLEGQGGLNGLHGFILRLQDKNSNSLKVGVHVATVSWRVWTSNTGHCFGLHIFS